MAHEFLYAFFNKKILVNFLVKNCHTKYHVSNLMHFQGETVYFLLKNQALGNESVKDFKSVI